MPKQVGLACGCRHLTQLIAKRCVRVCRCIYTITHKDATSSYKSDAHAAWALISLIDGAMAEDYSSK